LTDPAIYITPREPQGGSRKPGAGEVDPSLVAATLNGGYLIPNLTGAEAS